MTAQQLKNSILQLAVQGRLVSQDPNDEPASVLLEHIRAEKQRLIKEGKIKKEKPLPPIAENELPFDVPKNWEWVRVRDIVQLINGDRGKNYPSKDKLTDNPSSGLPFISAVNLENGQINTSALLFLSQQQYNLLGSGKFVKDDFIFCLRGSLGKNAIAQIDKGAIASSLVILRRHTNYPVAEYLKMYLDSPLLASEIKKYDNGTAQPNLSAESLTNFLFPLPPLAEQRRIVERIEQLLPHIAEYDDAEQKLRTLNKSFPERLKKSILQAAVQGKLVPQNPNDEPASELLERIRAEKEILAKEGKIKKEKPLPPIADEDIPFDVPKGWEWVRLGEVFHVIMGQSPDGKSVSETIKGIEFHQGKVFFSDYIISSSTQSTNEPTKIAPADSVLLCVRAPVGKVNVTDRELCIGRGLCAVQPLAGMTVDFAFRLLESYENIFVKQATGTTFAAITGEIVKNQLIPLPPLAEQHRIAAKCEELLALVEGCKK